MEIVVLSENEITKQLKDTQRMWAEIESVDPTATATKGQLYKYPSDPEWHLG